MVSLQAQNLEGGMAVPVISCPAVAGILLRLLLGCDDAGERIATLEALQHLVGALLQQQILLNLLQARAC